jgi:hypothetical protein
MDDKAIIQQNDFFTFFWKKFTFFTLFTCFRLKDESVNDVNLFYFYVIYSCSAVAIFRRKITDDYEGGN